MSRHHTSEDTPEEKESRSNFNFNSMLLLILIGVGGWVGIETVGNGKAIARLEEQQNEKFVFNNRIETKLNDLQQQFFDLKMQVATAISNPKL